MVLYDDFGKASLDPYKWNTWESINEIQNGKLVSEAVSHGTRSTNNLNFANPASIAYIQADVTITTAEGNLGKSGVNNCTMPTARITGTFYNDGSATGPGSSKGDVQAAIRIAPYNNQLRVFWNLWKALDDAGTNWSSMSEGEFTKPVKLNTTYTLSVGFNSDAQLFTFQIGSTPIYWGTEDMVNPTNVPWKAIGTDVQIVGTATDLYGKVVATFANVVATDESGDVLFSDDFSSPTLNTENWDFSNREILNRQFVSQLSANSAVRNSLDIANPDKIDEIQAQVTLQDFSNPDGAFLRSRIGGQYYNDTGDSQSGYLGDVWAEVGIGGTDVNPSLFWTVFRYNDAEGNSANATTLGGNTFPLTANLGEAYNLYIGWDGSTFTFKCNDQVDSYVPTGSKFAPNNQRKDLATRAISGGSSQTFQTFISAAFSDVWINGPEITPAQGALGTLVSISGFGFGAKKGNVSIGTTPLTVLRWTDALIDCKMASAPAAKVYDVTIQPAAPKGVSPIQVVRAFEMKAPEIVSVTQGSGASETSISIKGNFFGTRTGKVMLGATGISKSCTVTKWTMNGTTSAGEIDVRAPKNLPKGVYTVTVSNGAGSGTLAGGFQVK